MVKEADTKESPKELFTSLMVSDTFKAIADEARSASGPCDFYKRILKHIAAAFSAPYATIHIRLPSEVVDHYWHIGETSPDFWKPVAQNLLNDTLSERKPKLRLFTSKKTGRNISVSLMSVPISAGGSGKGAIVLVNSYENTDQAKFNLSLLEAMATLVASYAELTGQQHTSADDYTTTAKLVARLANYSSKHELAFSITNSLRNKTNCDQVILGIVRNKRIKILSISGHAEIPKQSPDIAIVIEAMEECYDMDSVLVCQLEKGAAREKNSSGPRLHLQWHRATDRSAVATIPLHNEDHSPAILALRRDSERPFSPDELSKIRELALPYAPALTLVERANRNLLSHLTSSIYHTARAALKPSAWAKKLGTVLLLMAAAWFLFGNMNYQVTVPATIVPARIRHVAAPAEAVLESASVVQADRVKKGDILCTFDQRELLRERETLLAQSKISQLEVDNAASRGSAIEARLARANRQYILAQLDILDDRIGQMVVRAPFDGLIVTGDLRKRLGQVIPMGEPLYQIAPSHDWLLELQVGESLSADLKTNLTGIFAANAKPQLTHELRIIRIAPRADLKDGRNVFLAQAQVDLNDDWVRAGMEGVAKIKIDRRRVWWVTLHRLFDFIRLKLWL
ncbi:MAG: HlyD family efflux transporter periplasmic adaptor subunit [Planctomycetes bacterium]|nr:HlyD family efflux transporter periplasmic adaptor subunit [Planctomycetota bacterium]